MDYRTLYAKTVAALRLLAKQNGVKLPAGASKMTIVQRILEKEHGYAEAAVDQLIQEETAGAEEPRAREPEKEETKAEPVSKLQDTEKSENIENSKAVLKMEKPPVSEEAVSENIPVIEKKEENPVPEKMDEAPVKRPRGRPRKTDEQRAALTEKLRALTGKSIVLETRTDASLLGGVRVNVEGRTYDNTLRNRIDEIGQALRTDA